MRLVGGLVAAALLAALASGASLFGIALWKIALAVLGAGLFALGGNKRLKN